MALTQVSTDGVKNDAITKTKIPANQIETSELAANAVTNAKIGNTEITGNKLADQAVSLDKLPHGDGSSDGKFLRANNGADPTFETVSTTPADGSISTAKIADNAVDKDKLAHGLHLFCTGSDKGIILQGNIGEIGDVTGFQAVNDAANANTDFGIRANTIRFATTSAERVRVTDDGLTFNGDTAAANALDDYETGTYTPTLTGISGTTSITLYEDKLSYTKIGNRIMISGRLRLNAANYSGGLRMSLPFAAASGTSCSNCGMSAVGTHGVNFPNSDDMGLFIETFAGQSLADFVITRDNSGWINATSSHITQYNYLAFNMHYQTT